MHESSKETICTEYRNRPPKYPKLKKKEENEKTNGKIYKLAPVLKSKRNIGLTK